MDGLLKPRADGATVPRIVVNDMRDGVLAFEDEDEALRCDPSSPSLSPFAAAAARVRSHLERGRGSKGWLYAKEGSGRGFRAGTLRRWRRRRRTVRWTLPQWTPHSCSS